jgi:hypothetical protein
MKLLLNDSYLAQAISKSDLAIMKQNITNDVYILNDTLIGTSLTKGHENAEKLTKIEKAFTEQTKLLEDIKLQVKDTVLSFLYDDHDHPSAYKLYSKDDILKLKLENNIHLSVEERNVLLTKI